MIVEATQPVPLFVLVRFVQDMQCDLLSTGANALLRSSLLSWTAFPVCGTSNPLKDPSMCCSAFIAALNLDKVY